MHASNNFYNILSIRFYKVFASITTGLILTSLLLLTPIYNAIGEDFEVGQLEDPIVLIRPDLNNSGIKQSNDERIDKNVQDIIENTEDSNVLNIKTDLSEPVDLSITNQQDLVSEINIATLANVNPDAAGIRTGAKNKLIDNLWINSSYDMVNSLIPYIPDAVNSSMARLLAKKILISPGIAPKGVKSKGEFLRTRVLALAKMEEYELAIELLNSAASFEDPELLARLSLLQSFKEYNFPKSCAISKEWSTQTSETFWKQTEIFCIALEGSIEAAIVSADLLQENGLEFDPFLNAFLDIMAGEENIEIRQIDEANIFQLAILKASGLKLPINITKTRNPGVLSAFIYSSDTPINIKLSFAEQAEDMGFVISEVFSDLYKSIEFTPEQLGNPTVEVRELDPSLARALLYQVAINKKVPVERGMAITEALEFSMETGYFYGTSRIFLPEIKNIDPKPLFSWFAPTAIRSLLAVGQVEAAQNWYSMIMGQIVLSPQNASVAIDLWPLLQIVNDEGLLDQDMLGEWWGAQIGEQTSESYSNASALLAILSSLGHKIEVNYWQHLFSEPLLVAKLQPSAIASILLEDALANNRVGEVALIGIMILGADKSNNLKLETYLHIIKAFWNVGLKNEARLLALEVALKHGF